MSEDWNTKYGTRRVRRDPPTLEEAIFAAVGITDDLQAQAEIAASLMGLPIESVQAEVKKAARPVLGRSTTRVIAGEQGAQRSIVVERRIVRKFGNDKRTGIDEWIARSTCLLIDLDQLVEWHARGLLPNPKPQFVAHSFKSQHEGK